MQKSAYGCGFLLSPTLIRQNLSVDNITDNKLGKAVVTIIHSPHDPWAELEVVRMIGWQYIVNTNTLECGENLYFNKIDPMAFIPYSFLRWDWWTK